MGMRNSAARHLLLPGDYGQPAVQHPEGTRAKFRWCQLLGASQCGWVALWRALRSPAQRHRKALLRLNPPC
jgi:hypothetical protein